MNKGKRTRYPASRKQRPLAERFWAKVQKGFADGDCWRWLGAKNYFGYGRIARGRKHEGRVKAHRLSWELHHGFVPDGLFVLHRYDNPECTNPSHLFLGTTQDNSSDMVSKGRSTFRLAPQQVEEIRFFGVSGDLYPAPTSSLYLARRYGVSRLYVNELLGGRPGRPTRGLPAKGSSHG